MFALSRLTRDSPSFKDELDIMKFICKDFWTKVFRRQVDNLRTNHQVSMWNMKTLRHDMWPVAKNTSLPLFWNVFGLVDCIHEFPLCHRVPMYCKTTNFLCWLSYPAGNSTWIKHLRLLCTLTHNGNIFLQQIEEEIVVNLNLMAWWRTKEVYGIRLESVYQILTGKGLLYCLHILKTVSVNLVDFNMFRLQEMDP